MTDSLFRRPTAWLPLAMSGAAFLLVVGYVTLHGASALPRQEDEGTPAHLYQLLMAGQVPIIALFVATALPGGGRRAIRVLALQLLAAFLAFAALFIAERLG